MKTLKLAAGIALGIVFAGIIWWLAAIFLVGTALNTASSALNDVTEKRNEERQARLLEEQKAREAFFANEAKRKAEILRIEREKIRKEMEVQQAMYQFSKEYKPTAECVRPSEQKLFYCTNERKKAREAYMEKRGLKLERENIKWQ